MAQNGSERLVAYASRTFSKNYSQIEKEAMAIVYRVKKIHHYLYGPSPPPVF